MNNRPETIRFYRKRLPHWEVADGRYFVTIRLKGAIPEAGMRRVRELRTRHDEAVANGQTGLEERRAVFREMEHWLDCAPTVDHLTRPEVAAMVVDAIAHREQQGLWTVYSYALMPNHIHLFFAVDTPSEVGTPSAPASVCSGNAPTGQSLGSAHLLSPLEAVLHDFKCHTARRANRLLGRHGQFWQREWFDHWSRSPEESDGIVRYIRANPAKAGLIRNEAPWPWLR